MAWGLRDAQSPVVERRKKSFRHLLVYTKAGWACCWGRAASSAPLVYFVVFIDCKLPILIICFLEIASLSVEGPSQPNTAVLSIGLEDTVR